MMDAYRIDPSGRWRGRLTSRPLPERDDAIDALTDDERARLAKVWLGRAATERRVSTAFVVIRDALRALRVSGSAIDLAERAIDDELRHAEICRYVASRFHGAELSPPPLLPLVVPQLPGASDELRHTLHVVGQCVLNETTASAFLEVCCEGARAELASAALRELLSDEIDHARIGWMHLSAVRPEIRAEVGRLMLPMARANLAMWRLTERDSGSSDVYAAHGAPSSNVIENSLVGAIRDLIIPGCVSLGINATSLDGWLAGGAPSD